MKHSFKCLTWLLKALTFLREIQRMKIIINHFFTCKVISTFAEDLVNILKYEFMPAILFCLVQAIFTPWGVNNTSLL